MSEGTKLAETTERWRLDILRSGIVRALDHAAPLLRDLEEDNHLDADERYHHMAALVAHLAGALREGTAP